MGREATQCTSGDEVSMHVRPASRPTAAPGARFGYLRRSTGYLQWAEGRAFATVRDETLRCTPDECFRRKGRGWENKKIRNKQLFVRNKVSGTKFELVTRASVEETGNKLSSGPSVEGPVEGVCVVQKAVQKLPESSSRCRRGPARGGSRDGRVN